MRKTLGLLERLSVISIPLKNDIILYSYQGEKMKNTKCNIPFSSESKIAEHLGTENFNDLNDKDRLTDPVFKAVAYPSKIYYPNIQKYIREYTKEGAFVLDSFSGSGSTGIAAALENRNAVLIDDSPYANFIQNNLFTFYDLKKIKNDYDLLINSVSDDINEIYKTISNSGKVGTLQVLISSNTYVCPNCKTHMDLNNNETGKRSEYRCPNCQEIIKISEQKIKSLKIDDRVPVELTLQYYDAQIGKNIKEVRKVTTDDIKMWENNINIVSNKYTNLWEPEEKIVYNRSYPRVGGWPGFPIHSKVGALFSEKNLLALKILNHKIDELFSEQAEKNFFKYVFTESLFRSSNRLFKASGIKNVYHIPPIGKEQNVLTVFNRKFKAIFKLHEFLQSKLSKEQLDKVYPLEGNARDLKFDDNLFDYAFIDPPYGGIVPYAELNLFYSAWLNKKEDLEHEINIPMDFDKKPEWAKKWGDMIEEAFKEVYRVLKPGAYFTLVFQSKFDTIWNELRDLMVNRIGFEFVKFDSNERGTTFHTNNLNDTNPKNAFITYRKPIAEVLSMLNEDTALNYLDPSKYQHKTVNLREIQDELLAIVHEFNIAKLPSDLSVLQWAENNNIKLK